MELGDDTCTICQEEMSSAVRLECAHIYCEDCIIAWCTPLGCMHMPSAGFLTQGAAAAWHASRACMRRRSTFVFIAAQVRALGRRDVPSVPCADRLVARHALGWLDELAAADLLKTPRRGGRRSSAACFVYMYTLGKSEC